MIAKTKVKFLISEYREKKDLFEACGYQEVKYFEKGINCIVTFEVDTNEPHYQELRSLTKDMERKGPPYFPIFIFVGIAFLLISAFVVLLIESYYNQIEFALWTNLVGFLLPAVIFLTITVIYTYFYFKINSRIVLAGPFSKEDFLKKIDEIKAK